MGRGLIYGILTFLCDNHYQLLNAMWVHDLCTFSGCLVGKTQESLLAVATVFLDLWTKLPMQELELKMWGGGGVDYARGGHNHRILWYIKLILIYPACKQYAIYLLQELWMR